MRITCSWACSRRSWTMGTLRRFWLSLWWSRRRRAWARLREATFQSNPTTGNWPKPTQLAISLRLRIPINCIIVLRDSHQRMGQTSLSRVWRNNRPVVATCMLHPITSLVRRPISPRIAVKTWVIQATAINLTSSTSRPKGRNLVRHLGRIRDSRIHSWPYLTKLIRRWKERTLARKSWRTHLWALFQKTLKVVMNKCERDIEQLTQLDSDTNLNDVTHRFIIQ